MSKLILLLFFSFLSLLMYAQDEYDDDLDFTGLKSGSDKINEFDNRPIYAFINFLGAGIGLETRIGKKMSYAVEGGSGMYFAIITSSGGNEVFFFPAPYVKSQFRYFHNFAKRQSKGKKTAGFSGNFIAPFFSYQRILNVNNNIYTAGRVQQNRFLFGPTYGMQRNFKKFGHFHFNAGIGYSNIKTEVAPGVFVPIALIVDVGLGFRF